MSNRANAKEGSNNKFKNKGYIKNLENALELP